MKKSENPIVGPVIGCIGGVIAAIIGGLFLLVSTGYLGGEIKLAQPTQTTDPSIVATRTAESKANSQQATADAIELMYQRALGNMNLERYEEALKDLEAIFRIAPNYKDVQQLIVQINLELESAHATVVASGNCQYSDLSDEAALISLINLEGLYALTEDLNGIISIWMPNGTVRDATTVDDEKGFVERYVLLFEEHTIVDLVHFDFELVANNGQFAWMISSVSGASINDSTGTRTEWVTDPLSDHWTFERDAFGCWRISNQVINAAGERFP